MRAEPGRYPSMSFETYLNLDAWGSSSLKAMRRGPPARVRWEQGNKKADTDATVLGSAVHCALLTPELFASTYTQKPEGMKFSTKEGKDWRDRHAAFQILSFEDYAKVAAIVASIESKRIVADSLEGSMRENSIVWKCPGSGELCKGRPDWINEERNGCVYDLKVTRHGGTTWMGLEAYRQGWMHQLAHYRTGCVLSGLNVARGRLVVVEPEPPHFVWTLEVKMDALDLLELENSETLKALRDCRIKNEWPGPPEEWVKLEPPAAAGLEAMNEVQFIEPEETGEGVSDA